MRSNPTEFRKRTQNRHLVAERVAGDPGASRPDQSGGRLESAGAGYRARVARLKEEFGTASSREMGSGDPVEVAPAALDGRVGTLLVDADQVVPGRVDARPGRSRPGRRTGRRSTTCWTTWPSWR